ncbi:hypothetical protein MD484_g1640, partial [Candolleomyces efflorescens]
MATRSRPNFNGRLYIVCIGHPDALHSRAGAWGVLLLEERNPDDSKLYSLVYEARDGCAAPQMVLGTPIRVNFFDLINNTTSFSALDDLIMPEIPSPSSSDSEPIMNSNANFNSTEADDGTVAAGVCLAYVYVGSSPRIAPSFNEDSEMTFRVCLAKALHHVRVAYGSANWSLEATQDWAMLACSIVHKLFRLDDFDVDEVRARLDARILEGRKAGRRERNWLKLIEERSALLRKTAKKEKTWVQLARRAFSAPSPAF